MDIDIANIISYITSTELQEKLFILKIVSLILSLFFLFVIFYSAFKIQNIKKDSRQGLKKKGLFSSFFRTRRITRIWLKIIKKLESGDPSKYKLAIIEAEDLLDNILKGRGYGGQTIGERLDQLTPDVFPNLNQILEAHRVRNEIISDPDYQISLDEAKRILQIYKETFHILGF